MEPFRRISAHYIYTVLSAPVKNGIVNIARDGKILSVEEPEEGKEGYNTEFFNGIVVPGFVNAHCHLELSYLKDVFESNCGMDGFISQMRSKRKLNEEKASDMASLYDTKMYREGVSVCADIVNSDVTSEVKERSKIRYYNFAETFGLNPSESDSLVFKVSDLKNKFKNSHIAPHALYSLSDKLFKAISGILKSETISSVHYLESYEEKEYLTSCKGKLADTLKTMGPVEPDFIKKGLYEIMQELFAKNSRVLLVHNTYSDLEDSQRINSILPDNFRVVCPLSNKFITGRIADIRNFSTDRICIGTDSMASNKDLSILSEIRALQDEFPLLKFEEILKWATINGAVALEASEFGSIEQGKRPGLILLENFDFQNMKIKQDTIAKRLV